MQNIFDFGKPLGGAVKDRYAVIDPDKFWEMTDAERAKFATRDKLWPLPDAIELVEAGADAFVVYWQRYMRRQTRKAPAVDVKASKEEAIKAAVKYGKQMLAFKARVEMVEKPEQVQSFHNTVMEECKESGFAETYGSAISIYSFIDVHVRIPMLQLRCRREEFPYKKHTSSAEAQRKPRFALPVLEKLERENLPDWRKGIDVDAEMWQQTLNFHTVQYGNSVPQKERRLMTNWAYDSMLDIALGLKLSNKDISFNGQISLAFGARGHGPAAAHFEPEYLAINLTRLKGAGCTAHEWFHALDYILAGFCGIHSGKLASMYIGSNAENMLPESFIKLIKVMRSDEDGRLTDFARGSGAFDSKFQKEAFGYWDSPCEMAARAFACYLKDTLGEKSDYLYANADVYETDYDNERVCAIPQDEERDIIDAAFDRFFFDLKTLGFFHERRKEDDETTNFILYSEPDEDGETIATFADSAGQLHFVV